MFPSGISEVLSCGITTSSESKLESCIGNIWRKINLRTASCATRLVRRRRRERESDFSHKLLSIPFPFGWRFDENREKMRKSNFPPWTRLTKKSRWSSDGISCIFQIFVPQHKRNIIFGISLVVIRCRRYIAARNWREEIDQTIAYVDFVTKIRRIQYGMMTITK